MPEQDFPVYSINSAHVHRYVSGCYRKAETLSKPRAAFKRASAVRRVMKDMVLDVLQEQEDLIPETYPHAIYYDELTRSWKDLLRQVNECAKAIRNSFEYDDLENIDWCVSATKQYRLKWLEMSAQCVANDDLIVYHDDDTITIGKIVISKSPISPSWFQPLYMSAYMHKAQAVAIYNWNRRKNELGVREIAVGEAEKEAGLGVISDYAEAVSKESGLRPSQSNCTNCPVKDCIYNPNKGE